jgi:L-alanine-DL-glutamate epimerase-like enolase superfamily enzyme
VASIYDSPIGTGENLFSTQDIENLVRFGGMRPDRDIIQIDVPQSYGIVQFSRTLEMLKRHKWQRHSIFPHGGNQMTLAIVGGFGLGGCEAYPGVFGIFAGFADDAKVENGYLRLPDRPGIGFEAQNQLYAVMRDLTGGG